MSLSQKDTEYLEAVEAVKIFGKPRGFVKEADIGPVAQALANIVQQNNVLIELAIRNSRRLEVVETELAKLKAGGSGKTDIDLKQSIEELTQKVSQVKISDKPIPTRVNRVYFYEDPLEIFKTEKSKK